MTHRVDGVYRAHPVCRKPAPVPGIGPLTATALLATVGQPQAFHNGRHLAACLGLVPRQYFSGGKERLGGLSKRGSRYVRMLLIHGARAVVQRAERRVDAQGRWLWALKCRKGTNVAAVAGPPQPLVSLFSQQPIEDLPPAPATGYLRRLSSIRHQVEGLGNMRWLLCCVIAVAIVANHVNVASCVLR